MNRSSRLARALALVLAPAILAAQSPAGVAHAGGPGATGLPNDARTITHALNRLAFGPRPGDVARVEAMGLAAYIEQQLHPAAIPDAALDATLAPLATLTMSARALADQYFVPAQQERRERQRAAGADGAPPDADALAMDPASPEARARRAAMSDAQRGVMRAQNELVQQRIARAIASERQLQEVLVDFWFNHFNVFAGKGAVRIYLGEYERDVIRPRVLGNFRDLLGAVARSPAMLFYLDNWMSTDPDAPSLRDAVRRDATARTRARGLAGTRRRGAAGLQAGTMPRRMADRTDAAEPPRAPRGLNENYGRELLELHTLGVDGGYTQADIVAVARAFTGWTIAGPRQGGGFAFVKALHDTGPKTVLGHVIDAGGVADGERVLDIVASHPATARFIATKLARRFVADDPPAALVDRAARVFTDTRGDLRAVTRAIVTSPEFLAPAAWRAKVKSPFEFLVSALRMTGAHVSDTLALGRALRELGQPLYQAQPPTGYVDAAATWVNTGALLARMNVALTIVGNRMRGVDLPEPPAAAPGAIRDAMLQALLAGDATDATRETVARAHDPARITALLLGSPEFQRR